MKAHATSSSRSTAIVMDLANIEADAAQILDVARAEAARIMADAKAAAERDALRIREETRKAGHQEGFTAGHAEGSKAGHDEAVAKVTQILQKLVGHWAETLDVLHANMPVHLADVKTDLIRLAIAIASRVAGGEALQNRAVAQATVEETLRLIGSARVVTLNVNKDELALLESYLPTLLAKMKTIESVELKIDGTITHGGCVARFGAGEIDARLETQIQRITDELLGAQ